MGEAKVQEVVDRFNKKVEEVLAAKDKDIMTI
jgi:ribosome recycling factor